MIFIRSILRKMFGLLEKVIDVLPNTYQIVKKWNISDGMCCHDEVVDRKYIS